MSLTHLTIVNAKPRTAAYKLSDGDSLFLVVMPSGSKLWRLNYRFVGKYRTMHLGVWPALSIAAARAARQKAREQIAAGQDPITERKLARLAASLAAQNTFQAVAEEWVAKIEREGRAPVTIDKVRWLLGMAYPIIGFRPLAQVTAQEALAVLRKVEATGRYESARRMRSVLSRVFRYGIGCDVSEDCTRSTADGAQLGRLRCRDAAEDRVRASCYDADNSP